MRPVDALIADPVELRTLATRVQQTWSQRDGILGQAGGIVAGLDRRGWDASTVDSLWWQLQRTMQDNASGARAQYNDLLSKAGLLESEDVPIPFGGPFGPLTEPGGSTILINQPPQPEPPIILDPLPEPGPTILINQPPPHEPPIAINVPFPKDNGIVTSSDGNEGDGSNGGQDGEPGDTQPPGDEPPPEGDPQPPSERNPAQDKKLTPDDIRRLKEAGLDPHDLKEGFGPPSQYDLYKDREGNIYVKPKGGRGAGDDTGININDP